jgi:HNH endonuclease
MTNTISQYRSHPTLSGCDAAFVLVIKAEHSEQNDALFAENMTGYWSIRDNAKVVGKAIFLVTEQVEGRRKLFGGVVEKIIPVDDKKVVQVKQFFPLPDITVGFQEFFGLRSTAPNSPTHLAIWSAGVEVAIAEFSSLPIQEDAALGQMVERLSWHRLNHSVFRNSVWKMWEGRCAVTGAHCNGVLVASHIKPWAHSTEQQRTEKHNGLLLSAGLDALFDRGLIGFTSDGHIIISQSLQQDTRNVFGISPELRLRVDCFPSQIIPDKMEEYLAWHQEFWRI